jgi:hypothetical protein
MPTTYLPVPSTPNTGTSYLSSKGYNSTLGEVCLIVEADPSNILIIFVSSFCFSSYVASFEF